MRLHFVEGKGGEKSVSLGGSFATAQRNTPFTILPRTSIPVKIALTLVFFCCILKKVIAPFVLKPKDPECERRLYRHLLRLNYEINMAKFTVDPDGDITLTVELPTENLDYSEFADAINALSYYADEHYLEILNLAQDPTARSRFEPEAEDLDWGES